jgi:type II secretory pathway pseudopilin PulG
MPTGKVRGFTYLGIIFAIALMGVVLAATGTIWSHAAQRAKEIQLMHVGNQFTRAIGLYYERSPGTVKRYPLDLSELLLDSRYLTVQRYLRRIYADPITGKPEWGLVRAPDGGIMGVYSQSEVEPIKLGNFRKGNERFQNAKRYLDWRFVYVPATGASVGTKPVEGK